MPTAHRPTPTAQTDPWRPPSAQQVTDYFAQHAPNPPHPARRLFVLIPIAAAATLALLVGGPAWLLLWATFIGSSLWARAQFSQRQNLAQRVERAQELVRLRFNRPALRAIWQLIPQLTAHPTLQHGAIVVLARGFEQTHQHDAALACYDRLTQDIPKGHPGAAMLNTRRAVAQLLSSRLADADQTLRRLRNTLARDTATPQSSPKPPDAPMSAMLAFIELLHATATAHYDQAIEESPQLINTLQPLGLDAGYGYALRALSHHHRDGQSDNQNDNQDDAAHARRWWQRATALIPANALVDQLPDLRPMVQALTKTSPDSQTQTPPNAIPAPTPPHLNPTPQSPNPALPTPAQLQRELTRDRLLRSLIFLIPVATLVAGMVTAWPLTNAFVSALVLLGVGWMALGLLQAPVIMALPALTHLTIAHPPAAATALNRLTARRGLSCTLRLTLYHHAAQITHRLGHTSQAAALAPTLVRLTPQPNTHTPASTRSTSPPHAALLLIIADAHLNTPHPANAYPALAALAHTPVTLDQSLKRLVLRTQYEVAIGAHHAALANLPTKADLSGLMPTADTQRLHQNLLTAAQAANNPQATNWLAQRVELLGNNAI